MKAFKLASQELGKQIKKKTEKGFAIFLKHFSTLNH